MTVEVISNDWAATTIGETVTVERLSGYLYEERSTYPSTLSLPTQKTVEINNGPGGPQVLETPRLRENS
jgi:hypothetical protein